MEEPKFRIRTYGFRELAQLYLPHIQPKSASMRLTTWIRRHSELSKCLRRLGYKRGTRILTPNMVDHIVFYLGEP